MVWFAGIGDIILPVAVGVLVWRIAQSYQGHIVLRPIAAMGEPWRVHVSRALVGVVAGFVVALVKYVGDDGDYAKTLIAAGWIDLLKLFLGYGLVPMLLGAVGGWISDESKVHKIFWVAISAPVIIAAAAGGIAKHEQPQVDTPGKAGWNLEQFLPITPAYGAEAQAAELQPQHSESDPFLKGLNLFLYGKYQPTRYRVVVHSVLDDKEKAEAIAKRLNKDFQLPAAATVGERKPGNAYWPIVLDGWTTYDDAKRLKENVWNMNFGLDDKPYISVENR